MSAFLKLRRVIAFWTLGLMSDFFTVKCAKEVGKMGLVIAVEPDPEALTLLRLNVKINQLSNVIIVNKAIFRRRGKLRLYIWPESGGSSFYAKTSSYVEVETLSLDDLISELKLEKVNFIKMDIEGAELEALTGAEKIFDYPDLKLAIAAYHIVNGIRTFYPLIYLLKSKSDYIYSYGYFIYAKIKNSLNTLTEDICKT